MLSPSYKLSYLLGEGSIHVVKHGTIDLTGTASGNTPVKTTAVECAPIKTTATTSTAVKYYAIYYHQVMSACESTHELGGVGACSPKKIFELGPLKSLLRPK